MRTLLHAICGLALAGCGLSDLEDREVLDETTQELSVSNWGPKQGTAQRSYYGGQVAALNGVTYLVHSGDYCSSGCDYKEIWWSQRTPTTGWTTNVRIPGQFASHKVSLAAFNGYVYMVHSGRDTPTNMWVSRFSPATGQWSENYQIAYASKGGPPALASFNGRLHLVGVSPSDNKLWHATMTAGEVFSAAVPLEHQYSVSRPSLAVYNNRLYVAHRAASETRIVYNSFDGTSWGSDQSIWAGPGGGAIEGVEPVLAAYDGHLHLLHRRPGSEYVWWTYFNGTTWAGEVTLGTLQTSTEPSLGTGANGLIALTTYSYDPRPLYTSTYTSPTLPPIDPPPCCIGLP